MARFQGRDEDVFAGWGLNGGIPWRPVIPSGKGPIRRFPPQRMFSRGLRTGYGAGGIVNIESLDRMVLESSSRDRLVGVFNVVIPRGHGGVRHRVQIVESVGGIGMVITIHMMVRLNRGEGCHRG